MDTVNNDIKYFTIVAIIIVAGSAARGGGGSFKNRKPIREIGCCESPVAGGKTLMDRTV